MPKVSVVIPCFNQGEYLEEAVDSVLNQSLQDLEVIVVNDGSSDPTTVRLLESFSRPRTRVIHTNNSGLPAARNNGIAQACSPYILPLDADDRIVGRYLQEGVAILDAQPEVGIVYCLAETFGAVSGPWRLPEFSPARICVENPIFCSALFRKSDWEAVGGYDIRMRYGWEDWDFWLSLVERGRQVVRISEVLFQYRVSGKSMTRTMGYGQKLSMMSRMLMNHRHHYARNVLSVLRIIIGKGVPG